MDYSHFSILLLLLALALLAAEVFVPSGGFISVMMLLALAGSVFCAYRAWWEASPLAWWSYIASVVLLIPAVLIAAFTVFPRTSYGQRVLLVAPDPDEIVGYAKEQAELQQLVGKRGKTITMHGPGGMVLVGDRRYHSETRGMLLDPGEVVEVVAVKGNRVVIRLADTPPHKDVAESPASDSALDVASASPGLSTSGTTAASDRAASSPGVDAASGEPHADEPLDPFVEEAPQDEDPPRSIV